MLPGAHKVYSTPDSSFWCCVGTGFENQAKYGEGIYYHTQNDLYINLFIPSDLNWKEKSFRLMQQTKFPEDGNMKFTIDEAPEFPLTINIRYPDWVAGRPTITINGRSIKIEQAADSYISIKRIWKKNDRIEVNYRMQLRTIPANDNPSVAAIAYGPVVLAGIMGTGNFKGREPYSDPAKHNDYYTYNYNVPANIDTVLSLDAANINQYIKQVKEQPLTFKTAKEQVVLRPLYDIHRERYVVYWHIIK